MVSPGSCQLSCCFFSFFLAFADTSKTSGMEFGFMFAFHHLWDGSGSKEQWRPFTLENVEGRKLLHGLDDI